MDEKGATFLCDLIGAGSGAGPASEPVAKAGSLYLIVLNGGIPGSMLRVNAGSNWLGRGVDNDLQVAEPTVSRRHASIRVDDDGSTWLTDLGSTNGTHHNGQRLIPHRPALLRDGDRVRFGQEVVVKFACPDPCEERFQREMFERTVRDALTGAYNRAYFLDQLGTLSDQAAQRGLGLAVLMLDIDHFKRVNDTYGHDAGDAVLRELADVIRQSTRPEDLVARYGGEEFVAALPIASPTQAVERAERIRQALAARRIAVGAGSLRVTASVGLAYSPPGRPPSASFALISAADRCLYQAKNSGRDRVVSGPDPLALPESQVTSDGEDLLRPDSVELAAIGFSLTDSAAACETRLRERL